MRLVFYTENYAIGGCDRFLVNLLANLDSDVFETSLAGNANSAFDRWLERRLPSHIPRHEVGVWTLPSLSLVQRAQPALRTAESHSRSHRAVKNVGTAAIRYAQAPRNYMQLRALLRRLRPDVLHINNGGYPGGETCRWAALAARAENVPGIIHFVHNMASPPAFPERIERSLDERIDRATTIWLTAAERASVALHEKRGIALDRIATIHYGIGVSTVASREGNPPVLAVVASFEPRKGHNVLLDALSLLKREGVDIRTMFIGDGEMRVALAKRTEELGLQTDVEFLGWRDNVPQILSKSDLLVLPSIGSECLPYAILEAMAQGLPVVATDVAGIPEEVVDRETGRVVKPGDSLALAQAIREVVADPVRARQMGERGRERVATMFSLERMVQRMSEIYIHAGSPTASCS